MWCNWRCTVLGNAPSLDHSLNPLGPEQLRCGIPLCAALHNIMVMSSCDKDPNAAADKTMIYCCIDHCQMHFGDFLAFPLSICGCGLPFSHAGLPALSVFTRHDWLTSHAIPPCKYDMSPTGVLPSRSSCCIASTTSANKRKVCTVVSKSVGRE